MTCHLYENVTIKLLTPEFLFDYENLNPIFFHENKLGGILSLNEHTIESHWEKKNSITYMYIRGHLGIVTL